MSSAELIETIQFPRAQASVARGSAGLRTQIPGAATTVTAVAEATGGMKGGALYANYKNKNIIKQ